ncbi:MAG: hypothetical protein ACOC80_12875 [Petrotogales bacterium]
MGKRYVIDPNTLEAVVENNEERNKIRDEDKPFVKYVNNTNKELPSKASNSEILNILSTGEVGFIKLEDVQDHKFIFQGIDEERITDFADRALQIERIGHRLLIKDRNKNLHELSLGNNINSVVGYVCNYRRAWEKLIEEIKHGVG